jgi:ketosteroid isomerase-like protein
VVALIAACAQPPGRDAAGNDPGEVAEVRAAIEAANAAFSRFLAAGQGDSLALEYTESGRWVSPGDPTLVGRAQIAAAITGYSEMQSRIDEMTIDELNVSGWIAVERGSVKSSYIPRGDSVRVHNSATYLIEWHKVDGRWLRANDFVALGTP